jgi:hypothetical protein
LLFRKAIDLADEKKYGKGHNDEIDDGVKKDTIVEIGCSHLLCFGEARVVLSGEVDIEARKINFSQQKPNGRHDDIVYQRSDDLAEGRANNDPNGHVEHISSHCELFELFHHLFLSL